MGLYREAQFASCFVIFYPPVRFDLGNAAYLAAFALLQAALDHAVLP